jgi:DNA invertase Pin-like site-specific DNA recombinase
MEPEPRGEIARHSKFARLTWADVAVMRRDFAAGTSRTELVKRYGVHPATINRVLNGSAWSKPVGKSQTADARPIVVGTS